MHYKKIIFALLIPVLGAMAQPAQVATAQMILTTLIKQHKTAKTKMQRHYILSQIKVQRAILKSLEG